MPRDLEPIGGAAPAPLGRAGRGSGAGRGGPAGSGPRPDAPAAAGAAGPEPQGAARPSLRPLAAAGFIALLRTGELPNAERAELLGGRVGAAETLGAARADAVAGLHRALAEALGGRAAEVMARPLVRLGPDDLLRPELAVLVGPGATAAAGVPPGAVALAVELVPSPAPRPAGGQDGVTARLSAYALGGVREVWLLDLQRGWTEVYRSPWGGTYGSRTLWYPGEEVPIGAVPGVAVTALGFG